MFTNESLYFIIILMLVYKELGLCEVKSLRKRSSVINDFLSLMGNI